MKPIVAIFSQDAQFYLLLSHILEVDGFETTPVVTIDEALELAHSSLVGAILLDCRPGSRISEAAALLKQDPATSDLAVVALLAAGSEDQQEARFQPMTPPSSSSSSPCAMSASTGSPPSNGVQPTLSSLYSSPNACRP
ncbi:hypothetical protein [Mesorhizobium sp. CN2-181]|uniref:hypothetical protein n=1 Tax=Mesorhizobium yinganensis TaxID=3157707 RepID=UPI0032B7885C